MLTAVVSGSFHRHMALVQEAVQELTDLGVRVLSPSDPRVVAEEQDFIFVASDRIRITRFVQDRHLRSIQMANFLLLATPDGYVGSSAAMEIGFAYACHTPILSIGTPSDLTLKQYVDSVPNVKAAVEYARRLLAKASPQNEGLIINLHASPAVARKTIVALSRAHRRDVRDVTHAPAVRG